MKTEKKRKIWRERTQRYRKKNREKFIIYARKYYHLNKKRIDKYMRLYTALNETDKKFYDKHKNRLLLKGSLWRLNNPEKHRAEIIARQLGKAKGLCIICKKRQAKDKHHEDYLKPLEVMFVCRSCHTKLDKIRKSKEVIKR